MFRLINSVSAGELVNRQLPVFLVTWFDLDGALQVVIGPRSPERFQR